MRNQSIRLALARATGEVLERMFFLEPVAEPEAVENTAGCVAATLAFDGELQGTLSLAISPRAAATLTGDFLGLSEEEAPRSGQVEQVVCELANMICGVTLSALERSALRLSQPSIVPPNEFVLPADPCRHTVDLGIGLLTVALAIRKRDA